jgi:hypothetical protein
MPPRWSHALLLPLGAAAALLLAFHPMIFSGFARTPGDLGDSRLINFLLEHTYRWLLRRPHHLDLWSPPVFYPAQNTAAYSDLLVSAGPFYWCWRALGAPADTAFQLWMLTVLMLNYVSMCVFLARVFRVRALAAAAGAALFAAGGSRLAACYHPQLYPHFFTVVALYALARFFAADADRSRSRLSPGAWAAVFGLAVTAQLYASFYLGWFLGLALLVAVVVAVLRRETRRPLFAALRRRWRPVLGWGAASAALLAPLAWHYLEAAGAVGTRSWLGVAGGLPTPWGWVLADPTSWYYGGLPFLHARPNTGEMDQLGVGLLTAVLAAWGLWRGRKSPAVALIGWTAAALFVLTLSVPPYVSLWYICYYAVPGGSVIRAAHRVSQLVLIAAAAGVASFLDGRRRVWVAAALALLCLLE